MSEELEAMDTSNNASKLPLPKSTVDAAKDDKDEAEMKVSLYSPEPIEPKKFQREMTKTLQSWANKNGLKGEFTATKISDDGRTAFISVKPATALEELQELCGQVLNTKTQKTFSMKLVPNEPLTADVPPEVGQVGQVGQVAQASSLTNGQVVGMRNNDSSAEDVIVALGPYWYMKSTYPDRIKHIQRQNGVEITEHVQVSISAVSTQADPKKAHDEFIKLAQSCLNESSSLTIPLKTIGPEEWKETLKFIQSTDEKCQITISSDHVTIFGPQQYQIAISKSLQRPQIITNYTDEERMKEQERERPRMDVKSFEWEPRAADQSRIRIKFTSKDLLVSEGLTFEDQYWDLIKKLNKKDFDRIKDKFNVTFKDRSSHGKTLVKVRYNKPEGNMSMESHAIRALLRLYQSVATTSFRATNGTFVNFEEDLYRSVEDMKGAYSKTSMDRQADNTKRSTEGGANKKPSGPEAKKDEKEETCPVCMDVFKEKTVLRCKHEFCKDCLAQSVKSLGAICPVCKDVFGLVEGDQPDGTMTWTTSNVSLPGYNHCGSIQITYHIPGGIQTGKHPNPGRHYSGTSRTAYLPDNKEGNEVLKLLKRAFDQRLIFTVGISRTTGLDGMVTWNDIHHKTSTHGGPQGFGYPDPDYLSRVTDELKSKGIKR